MKILRRSLHDLVHVLLWFGLLWGGAVALRIGAGKKQSGMEEQDHDDSALSLSSLGRETLQLTYEVGKIQKAIDALTTRVDLLSNNTAVVIADIASLTNRTGAETAQSETNRYVARVDHIGSKSI